LAGFLVGPTWGGISLLWERVEYENKPIGSGHMLTTEWQRVGHENKLIYK
jgi:hypothetical protein